MFRRHFLMGGIGIATAGTAFANSDGKLVSSIVEAIGAGGPVMIRLTASPPPPARAPQAR
jgi:hypothetical protein